MVMVTRRHPAPRVHAIAGDGMVVKVCFRGDGTVSFQNRFVRTAGFVAEQASMGDERSSVLAHPRSPGAVCRFF